MSFRRNGRGLVARSELVSPRPRMEAESSSSLDRCFSLSFAFFLSRGETGGLVGLGDVARANAIPRSWVYGSTSFGTGTSGLPLVSLVSLLLEVEERGGSLKSLLLEVEERGASLKSLLLELEERAGSLESLGFFLSFDEGMNAGPGTMGLAMRWAS